MFTIYPGYIRGDSWVFHGCFKGVLWVNQGCFKGFKGVSNCVPRSYKGIFVIFPEYITVVTLVTSVLWLYYGYQRGFARVLHFCSKGDSGVFNYVLKMFQ